MQRDTRQAKVSGSLSNMHAGPRPTLLAAYQLGQVGTDWAVFYTRQLLRERHHRLAAAKQQYRWLRGLRHQQQSHHERGILGGCGIELAGYGFRQFSECRRE